MAVIELCYILVYQSISCHILLLSYLTDIKRNYHAYSVNGARAETCSPFYMSLIQTLSFGRTSIETKLRPVTESKMIESYKAGVDLLIPTPRLPKIGYAYKFAANRHQ